MKAQILDGRKVSQKIIDDIKKKTEHLDVKPCLAVISVGKDEASKIYVKNKIKKASEAGFNSILREFGEDITKEELLAEIEKLNDDNNVHAILLQLPLPKHLNSKDFLDKIDFKKDVDGFNSYNAGKLYKAQNPLVIPCTPKGILRLFEEYKIDVSGKTSVVIGRSNIVGKPMAMTLLNNDATVIMAHSKTKNLKEMTLLADIIISCTGKKGLITGDMVKNDAVVVDVGIIRNEDKKLTGDVVFDEVANKASYITPVPGGVGPMTIASLIENTYILYLFQTERI